MNRTVTILLGIFYLSFIAADVIPSPDLSIFTPSEEELDIPPDQFFIITANLKDASGNPIQLDEDHQIYKDISCVADTPPPPCRRCSSFDPEFLNKTIDSEGIIHCTYEEIPWNKTTIEVKYKSQVLKTYVVGKEADKLNLEYSYGTNITGITVDNPFSFYYYPRDNNDRALSRYAFDEIIKDKLLFETDMSSLSIHYVYPRVQISGKTPTIVDDYYLNLYFMEDQEKVYIYNTTMRPIPEIQWDAQQSVISVPQYIYGKNHPNTINKIKFVNPVDKFGNTVTKVINAKVKIYSSPAHQLIWESDWLFGNENNELTIEGSAININHMGQIRVGLKSGFQTYEQQPYSFLI